MIEKQGVQVCLDDWEESENLKHVVIQGSIIPAKILSIKYFAYYIILGINTNSIMLPVNQYFLIEYYT